ncbi:MAG: hypothetical protein GVY13_18960 [Alphaproteobacteria bacterium]|jgi:uncharacterized protein|nr:hypothetical protein [Alphaproteobacteria bacterium]
MDMTPLIPTGKQIITAYRPGGFKVSGAEYQGSVIVFPDRVVPWPVASVDDLSVDALEPVTAEGSGVEVLLIGCGVRMAPLVRLKKALRESGVGADPMDTGAACRTFNVLLAEERRVAAALIAL